MNIKNLKITQKGRRLLSTVAVVLTISPFLNAHAYALDKDVSVNTNTTISENKDEVLKTTTYLVEFNETRRFNDELSAKSKKKAYEIKQKAIKDEVVKNGGFYNYSVNINKIYGSEVSTTYKVDCNNLSDLENQIKILKNNFSNSEITATSSSEIRGKVDLGTIVLDNNYKTYNDAKSAIDLKVLEYNKINANLKNYWIDKVFVKTNENNLTISLEGKTEEEIASIKTACEITDKCFDFIKNYIKPGLTEKQIAKKIQDFYRDHSEGESFETIVASGENSSKPHAVPTDRKIKERDIITIDMGCKVNGYCSDMTRTIFVGEPTYEQKKVYNLVLSNQKRVLNDIREGANIKQLTKSVESDFQLNNQTLIHALGHGVGLEIHEDPAINLKNDSNLKENMIITDEPGIYIAGNFGVRIEDTILVTKKGAISLTESDKECIII